MAKGQDLSRTQRGIVNRYYQHRDGIMAQKLSELVSDLYLAEGSRADALWKRVGTALANTDADPGRAASAVRTKDLKALAELVAQLQRPGGTTTRGPSA